MCYAGHPNFGTCFAYKTLARQPDWKQLAVAVSEANTLVILTAWKGHAAPGSSFYKWVDVNCGAAWICGGLALHRQDLPQREWL